MITAKHRIYLLLLALIPLSFAHASVVDFPQSNDTPEGVVVNFAHSWINIDPELFVSVCIPPFGGGESRDRYEGFLTDISTSILADSKQVQKKPKLVRILRLYKSRPLTSNGPLSYGQEVFGFEDIRFVDIVAEGPNGDEMTNRILCIKKTGSWYVHPNPKLHPLLSTGLYSEPKSTELWKTEQNGSNKTVDTTATNAAVVSP